MARPKKPTALADLSGASIKNPQRYKAKPLNRALKPLGEPSVWLTDPQRSAWVELASEVPWLSEENRALVEITAILRARLGSQEPPGVSAMNQLRLCLAMMGATPADRGKVAMPVEPHDDPEDALFQ